MPNLLTQHHYEMHAIPVGKFIKDSGFIIVDPLSGMSGFSVECATEAECMSEFTAMLDACGALET